MHKKCLSKQIRLLSSKEFAFVFKKSKCIRVIGMTLFSRFNQLGYPRIGLAISKKYIKCAHERNRIKRYIRETFRINQHNLSTTDFVLTVHSKEILYLNNDDLVKELKKLWYHHWHQ